MINIFIANLLVSWSNHEFRLTYPLGLFRAYKSDLKPWKDPLSFSLTRQSGSLDHVSSLWFCLLTLSLHFIAIFMPFLFVSGGPQAYNCNCLSFMSAVSGFILPFLWKYRFTFFSDRQNLL